MRQLIGCAQQAGERGFHSDGVAFAGECGMIWAGGRLASAVRWPHAGPLSSTLTKFVHIPCPPGKNVTLNSPTVTPRDLGSERLSGQSGSCVCLSDDSCLLNWCGTAIGGQIRGIQQQCQTNHQKILWFPIPKDPGPEAREMVLYRAWASVPSQSSPTNFTEKPEHRGPASQAIAVRLGRPSVPVRSAPRDQ